MAADVEQPGIEEDHNDPVLDAVNAAVQSNIGRVVAAGMALALPFIGAFCAWVQDIIGIDLNSTELSVYIGTIITGAALAGWQWLRNRGAWETQSVKLLHDLYTGGQSASAFPPSITMHPDWNEAAFSNDVGEPMTGEPEPETGGPEPEGTVGKEGWKQP
jgi:hypothetical protein